MASSGSPAQVALESLGRPVVEINTIWPAVNTALGYQINNRLDISYRPRGGEADQATADVLSKVSMKIMDDNKFPWIESAVFADGLIQQRGFFEVRMDFDENLNGKILIQDLDPLDVIPDPDAQSYDPDGWSDVTITRWMSFDDIEGRYGAEARAKVENARPQEADWGEELHQAPRNAFGEPETLPGAGRYYDSHLTEGQMRRVRVLDRQYYRMSLDPVLVYPASGDIRPQGAMTEDEVAEQINQGAILTRQVRRRIRWSVSTSDILLHDDWSPYHHFTVVPYFAYFRRGRTRGMVDNAVSAQEVMNKSISQYLAIVNTSANSGWQIQENSLTNMATEDLEERGAETGLVLEYRQGAQPPQKIAPNAVPSGINLLADKAELYMKVITGISDAMQGLNGPEVSGIAIQSKQFAGQTQMAVPLDNLNRTRHLLAVRLLRLIQDYYTEPQVMLIAETDQYGREIQQPLAVNQPTEGGILNDLTIGEYDVVVSDQPTQVTFQSAQFTQAVEMRKIGVAIPDQVLVENSNLSKKHDILQRMAERPDPAAQARLAAEQARAAAHQASQTAAQARLAEAKARTTLIEAQRRYTDAQATSRAVEAQYSAIQTAQTIASIPETAEIADTLLRSAGYQDADEPPIVPTPAEAMAVPPAPPNTHPLTPTNPTRGLRQGIETPENDAVEDLPP